MCLLWLEAPETPTCLAQKWEKKVAKVLGEAATQQQSGKRATS